MELDDLKAGWQQAAQALPLQPVERLLQGKTADLLTRVRRKYERIITLLMVGMLLFVVALALISNGFRDGTSAWGLAKGVLLYLIVLFFYWEKYRSLRGVELEEGMKERLQQLLHLQQKSQRVELWFTGLLFAGMLVVARVLPGRPALDKPDVVIGFCITFCFVGAMVALIIRRHRRVIRELKGYLAEWEERTL